MILEIGGERIGFLWVGPHPRRPNDSEAAWLYNIEIDEDRRGQGFGRAGMALVEAHLALAGVTELGLNVFGGNDIARRLYATGWLRRGRGHDGETADAGTLNGRVLTAVTVTTVAQASRLTGARS